MKVAIRRILNQEEEQVIIECTEITQEIKDIRAYAMTKRDNLIRDDKG